MPDIPPHPSTPLDGWTPLKTAHCSAAVSPLGAILHDLTFTLPDGRKFAPLAEAEWSGRARPEDSPDLSPHLAELGGEWPCVPFGTSPADPQHHGFCSNAVWRLDAADGGSARLSIDYPAGHDIAQVARSVRLSLSGKATSRRRRTASSSSGHRWEAASSSSVSSGTAWPSRRTSGSVSSKSRICRRRGCCCSTARCHEPTTSCVPSRRTSSRSTPARTTTGSGLRSSTSSATRKGRRARRDASGGREMTTAPLPMRYQ